MKRSLILTLPVLLVAMFGLAACGGGNGNGDAGCTGSTPYKCQDNQCHECCIDDDCASDEICNEAYVCELICEEAGGDCSKDASSCCDGLGCDVFSATCMTCCTSDEDCKTSHSSIPFADDLKCKGGCLCDFDHCSTDATCPPGKVCFNGDCVTKPDCSDIASCTVLPMSAVTQQGTTADFSAAAYLASGALAPGMSFDWSSSDDTIAAVAGGTVTGGATTGTATITATVSGCTTTCTASVANYGDVQGGETRVVVVSELEGTPIQGASVVVGAEAAVTTDAQGAAIAGVELSAGNPGDVTVTHEEYSYVTLRAVESNDVIVHMGRLYQYDFAAQPPTEQAGGVKGKFDFTRIPCQEGDTCDVLIGLGGLSIPGNLVNINFDLIVGGMIKTAIELGGTEEVIPLPSGLTLCLNTTCFKEFYTPTGVPGNRVAWGLGGKLNLSELINILGPVISGGGEDINIGAILASLLPMFGEFYTAMVPNVEIDPIPKVDDVNDIDDDPGTLKVPDYDSFDPLNMTLKVGMDQSMTFNIPAFGAKPGGGYYYDGVIVLAGVIVRGAGLVPLGLSAGVDSLNDDDPADGVIDDPVVVNVADVAGRIPEDQVQRVVVALALNLSGLMGSSDEPFAMAGQVIFVNDFAGTQSLASFLTPAVGTYDENARTLTLTDTPATDYQQAIFTAGDEVNWHVIGEWANGTYTLPAAPAEGDRAHSVAFIGINLKDSLGFQDLAAFNSTNLADLVQLVETFCFADIPDAP